MTTLSEMPKRLMMARSEVIEEIKTWNHPDTKSFIMWLSKTFKLSAEKL
jgi:hypothetical protein